MNMSTSGKNEFGDTQLMQYLLGSLSPEESERLDELSLTDDDIAWRLRAVENDLVDAYVRAELTGTTLQNFRAFYLASPKRREKVAFAEELLRFQSGAAKAAVQPSEKNSFFSRMFAPRRMTLQFAAAAFAMVLVFGYLIFDNARLRYQMNESRAQQSSLEQSRQELEKELREQRAANAGAQKSAGTGAGSATDLDQLKMLAVVLPPPTRGLGPIKTITVHPNADLAVLLLTLEVADFPRYRVTLKDPATNVTLWRSADLETTTISGRPALAVSVRASLLKTQNYVAEVSGVSRSGHSQIIGDYPFNVVLR
jgi:hypothetical protein